jgi:hypothetical protein
LVNKNDNNLPAIVTVKITKKPIYSDNNINKQSIIYRIQSITQMVIDALQSIFANWSGFDWLCNFISAAIRSARQTNKIKS